MPGWDIFLIGRLDYRGLNHVAVSRRESLISKQPAMIAIACRRWLRLKQGELFLMAGNSMQMRSRE